MKPEEVLNAIFSQDEHEVWKASWEIISAKKSCLIRFYLPHLNQIKDSIDHTPVSKGLAVRSPRGAIRLALKVLETVSCGLCRCTIYQSTDQILPENQVKNGLIEINEKQWKPEFYEDRYECTCTECGQYYVCLVNHNYHYPWAKWIMKKS